MKTPQYLNPLGAFKQFAQNWHSIKCAALTSGEFLPALAARIRAFRAPRLPGRDLPDEEFMTRFAQELARWPAEFSLTPPSRQRYGPKLINTADEELDIASACRPPHDLLDGYIHWLAPSFGDVAFVIGEGTDTSERGLCVDSLIRHYFRVTGGGELLKPKRLACDLNGLVFDSRYSQTISCFYAHYTASTRFLRYFNAGHRSPLLLRSRPDQVIRLNKGGPPLGSAQAQSYSESILQLKSGDRLLAFTSGVTESWVTPSDCLGEMALLNIMRGWRDESAEEIANLIVADGPGAAWRDRIAIAGSINDAPSIARDACMDCEVLRVATS